MDITNPHDRLFPSRYKHPAAGRPGVGTLNRLHPPQTGAMSIASATAVSPFH